MHACAHINYTVPHTIAAPGGTRACRPLAVHAAVHGPACRLSNHHLKSIQNPTCTQYPNICIVLVLVRDQGSGRITIDK